MQQISFVLKLALGEAGAERQFRTGAFWREPAAQKVKFGITKPASAVVAT